VKAACFIVPALSGSSPLGRAIVSLNGNSET
jgi:hypothetical protein